METVFSPHGVWVVGYNGMYDIDKIYIVKNDAILAAAERNESNKPFLGMTHNPYIVMTLGDAIDLIKDEVRDDARIQYDNEL